MKILLLLLLALSSAEILQINKENYNVLEKKDTVVFYMHAPECTQCKILDEYLDRIDEIVTRRDWKVTVARISLGEMQNKDSEHYDSMETLYFARNSKNKIDVLNDDIMNDIENFLEKSISKQQTSDNPR